MYPHNQTFGAWGEAQARAFLTRHGFLVIDRNFHTAQGEIDIVATKGGDYYFIEVKSRFTAELATDLAVTKQKIHKLQKTVKTYCFKRNIMEGSYIICGLVVAANRINKTLGFRLAAYC